MFFVRAEPSEPVRQDIKGRARRGSPAPRPSPSRCAPQRAPRHRGSPGGTGCCGTGQGWGGGLSATWNHRGGVVGGEGGLHPNATDWWEEHRGVPNPGAAPKAGSRWVPAARGAPPRSGAHAAPRTNGGGHKWGRRHPESQRVSPPPPSHGTARPGCRGHGDGASTAGTLPAPQRRGGSRLPPARGWGGGAPWGPGAGFSGCVGGVEVEGGGHGQG